MTEPKTIPGGKPDPDPTLLTTENLRREIFNLRELVNSRLDGLKDSGTALQSLMMSNIERLREVTTEKFLGVAAQFSERDTRTDQRAGDTKLAVDAAFAAAKEATAKIEAGFTKQIDAMTDIIDTKTSNLSSGLQDIKDRMAAMESRFSNITTQRSESRDSIADSRANLALIVSAAGVLVLVALHFVK